MKHYEGRRVGHATVVTENGIPLNSRLDLRKHSPTGFDWGYNGSAPTQLALALLADCLQDAQCALTLHKAFKWAVVVSLSPVRWTLSEHEIKNALRSLVLLPQSESARLKPRFACGYIVAMPNVLSNVTEAEIIIGIQRHQAGDWGDVDEEDCQANECALIQGKCLRSMYPTDFGAKIVLLTEDDRSSTVIFFQGYY